MGYGRKKIITSFCGVNCEACKFFGNCNLRTCVETEGKPFYMSGGQRCDVAKCCLGKNLAHCGLCKEFPCDLLKSHAYDPEHGDNGARLENCKKWCEIV